MILQGTNIPITVEFEQSVEGFPKLVATLWGQGKLLKKWEKPDMTISTSVIQLPVDEDETRKWKKGKAKLDIKGLNQLNQTVFWEDAIITIEPRDDKDVDLID